MTIKIWKKNKDNKIEIISKCEVALDPMGLAKDIVAKSLIEALKANQDYGYVDLNRTSLPRYALMENVSKTTLANVLEENVNEIITVSFNKKDGSERVLTGYTNGDKDSFGRYYFIEISSDEEQIRLVDPRELNWIHMVDQHNPSEYMVLSIKGVRP